MVFLVLSFTQVGFNLADRVVCQICRSGCQFCRSGVIYLDPPVMVMVGVVAPLSLLWCGNCRGGGRPTPPGVVWGRWCPPEVRGVNFADRAGLIFLNPPVVVIVGLVVPPASPPVVWYLWWCWWSPPPPCGVGAMVPPPP